VLVSIPVTWMPLLAKMLAVGSPMYPIPITHSVEKFKKLSSAHL
jgi:hypothetical protein